MTSSRPSWNELPDRPQESPEVKSEGGSDGTIRALLGPLCLGLAAALIWRAGRFRTARVMAVVAVLLAVGVIASPALRAVLGRASRKVTAVATTVLSFVFLLPAYYLVVFPLGALMRLCGARPLDVSWDPARPSYWTVRSATANTRPRRMFTDQRGWKPLGFSPSQRRRVVVRTVIAMVLIEAIVATAVVYVVHNRHSTEHPLVSASAAFASTSAAVQGYAWAPEAYREQAAVTNGLVYTPFTGVSLRDYSGRYFNVKDRVRESYVSPLTKTRKPVEIWFFGGSTMFGFDLLRDDHTIPSEIVRLAEKQGIAVSVRNYGMAGYVNYQESVLLSLLVTSEKPPDLVVFYDGTNDASMSLLNAYGGLNPPGEPGDLGALQQRSALATSLPDSSIAEPSPLGLRPATKRTTKPTTVDSIVSDAAGIYRQGFDLSRTLAKRYGFQVMHFWQPDYYTKTPLDPAEKALANPLGLDRFRLETMTALWARIRKALPAGVVDISTALDGLSGPILTDSVHTNERGSLAVSKAMFPHLLPALDRLTAKD